MKKFTITLVMILASGKLVFSQGVNPGLPGPRPNIQLRLQANILADKTTIAFSPFGTPQFDSGYDSMKVYSSDPMAPAISSLSSTLDLSVNTLPATPLSATIPIKVKVGITGKYILSADSILAMPAGTCIYLEDLETGILTDLNASPSNNFIISDTTTAPRFLLHISQPMMVSAINPSCSYTQDGMAILNCSGTWTSVWQNAAGDTIGIHSNAGPGQDTLAGLSGGTYMVSTSGATSCANVRDTFLISIPSPVAVNASVTNLTCRNTFGSINAAGISGGQAPYAYQWTNGSTSAVLQHLSAGVYALFITDAKGCSDTMSYAVERLSNLQAGFSANADTLTLANPTAVLSNSTVAQTSLTWDFGDGSLTEQTYNTSHTYSAAGTYTVMLVAADAYCSDTARHAVTVLNNTSINQYSLDHQLMVQGSDEGASVKFGLDAEAQAMINVYAADGKLLASRHVSAYRQTETIPLQQAAGMYLVEVSIHGYTLVKKLIK